MRLYAANSHVVYMAILYALRLKRVRIPAVAPTFFATGARLLGVDVELVDVKLDMGAEADVVHNFYETFSPRARVVFQGAGASVGECEVYVKKHGGSIEIELKDEELGERIGLFLDGGVKRGRLWNYDLVDLGIKDRGKPQPVAEGLLEEQNRVVCHLNEAFADNPYFDQLKIGTKTIKSGYPILLKPSLYCPKEDIYQELRNVGVDVQVRFKPLYKTRLLAGDSMPVSEELYKAIMILPLRADIVEPVLDVFERYRYRGCSF